MIVYDRARRQEKKPLRRMGSFCLTAAFSPAIMDTESGGLCLRTNTAYWTSRTNDEKKPGADRVSASGFFQSQVTLQAKIPMLISTNPCSTALPNMFP